MPDPSRAILPIPEPRTAGPAAYSARDPEAVFPPITPIRPPAGAPNVLVVLLDDVGFGASSAFGGPCHTPTAERLAAGGLKFNRFHTTALCSPTRQALLTGRNHHAVGMGMITEIATSAPGYNSIRPRSAAPVAETLRLNGYATAQFGKCHEVPVWEAAPVGPFDHWPTSSGFEHFYGFVAAETNQYYPTLWEGTTPVDPPSSPDEGYHLTEDLADRACDWVRQQQALTPDKPFFLYWAPGATHAPHHVPAGWADKYAGQFDDGWDALREKIFARQRALGVIPPEAELTARPEEIPAWNDTDPELRGALSRQMEIFAGFLEHTDHQLGRVVATLEELGVLDDTLVVYVIGDNGASAEGGPVGTFNELLPLNAVGLETADDINERIGLFGTKDAYNHYAVGWAHATNTPYQWTKQIASHFGGVRNGTIVHWPNGIAAAGEVRTQFHHVIDIAPTILDVAGLPHPHTVHGVEQMPIHGVSMRYAFDDAAAEERHVTQYFEMFCNRGIYHRGWTAVTRHGVPWLLLAQRPALDDDVWELYDTSTDWSQARDLASVHPDKLAELQRLFIIEATKYGVLPLDDRVVERAFPVLAGRPVLGHADSQRLYPGMGRLLDSAITPLRNTSHAITAQIDVPGEGATGVLLSQGGQFGGWSLFFDAGGHPTYAYNFVGLDVTHVRADAPLPPGEHQLRAEFDYAGPGLGLGGTVTLYLDGGAIAEGHVARTAPFAFGFDVTANVGVGVGAPVSDRYPADSRFTGRVHWVQVEAGENDSNHLITPEDRLRVATALQ